MTYLMKTVHTNKTKELNVANDINVNLLTGIGNVIASSARDSSVEAVQIGAKINKEKVWLSSARDSSLEAIQNGANIDKENVWL